MTPQEFQDAVIDRLARIEVKQDNFTKWVTVHEKESADGYARLTSVEGSINRAKGMLAVLYVLFGATIGTLWRKMFG